MSQKQIGSIYKNPPKTLKECEEALALLKSLPRTQETLSLGEMVIMTELALKASQKGTKT